MSRLVNLVLVRPEGAVVGSLPPYRVERPWWSEVESVVAGARDHHGADIVVLRLLEAEADVGGRSGLGGSVVYLAEIRGEVPPAVTAEAPALDDDDRRLSWARPGGPTADLAWADEVLRHRGVQRTDGGVQLRTWNLSSIWRLTTDTGLAWLKVTPPLLAHEGAVINALAGRGAPVPPLIAYDGKGRVLLDHVDGENQWGARRDQLLDMVDVLVGIQADWIRGAGAIRALGGRDWRREAFMAAAGETVASWSERLPAGAQEALNCLVEGLDRRFEEIEACGLPDTLVHGDFHPGNFRFDGHSMVLLDWGDCGVGNPLLDLGGFFDWTDTADRVAVQERWFDRWREAVPGCDPGRAGELVRPLAALRRAITYDRFTNTFEPSERVYHEADVPQWLLRAASLAA